MRRTLWITATISAATAGYLAWALTRLPPFIRMAGEPEYDPAFPRTLPWPDPLIVFAESAFNEPANPSTGVEKTAFLFSAGFMGFAIAALVLLILGVVTHRKHRSAAAPGH
ncbi:MAG: hypothetical protein AAF593_02800 [Planctomycetota bacterium]